MALWTEDEMYELAKKVHPPKLPTQPSPPSLKDLCLRFTMNRWKTWTDLNETFGINAFDNMSPLLRNDLVARLTSFSSFNWAQREFLLLLLNTDTKVLKLNSLRIKADHHEECPVFFAQLVSKAPNLVRLSFSFNGWTPKSCDLIPRELKNAILNTLVELKNLQYLNLTRYFGLNNDNLMLVAKNLKNLVCLKVILMANVISPRGLNYLSCLKKLEEFHFFILFQPQNSCKDTENATKEWIYSWCAQFLPKLKQIVHSDDTTHCGVTPTFTGTSNLETIQTASILPEASMPRLEKLIFDGDIEDPSFLVKLSAYKNLTSLSLLKVNVKDFENAFVLIGTQLSNLYIDSSKNHNNGDAFDYFKLFYFCPNLKRADLFIETGSVTPIDNSQFKELVTVNNFSHLETIIGGLFYRGCPQLILPAGLMSLIFQAPLIERVTFGYVTLRKEDCVFLSNVVEGRFKNLEMVSFFKTQLEPGLTLDDVGNLVKSLVCGAPNLFSIEIGWYNDDDYPEDNHIEWLMEQTAAIKFMDLLPSFEILE